MSLSEVRGAANAANGGHDAAAANGSWDVASATIDAIPAMQSLCDANAAKGTWMLAMQQCHKCSKGHDTYAAKRMHAVVAAINTPICCMRSKWIWRNMVTVSVFRYVAKPAITVLVSVFRCRLVSLFQAMKQPTQCLFRLVVLILFRSPFDVAN